MTPALTILIADHHEDVLDILKEQLATTNYALLHARNGEEAIGLLERLKSQIELAIINLELPDFGGWDLIGRLTLHDRRPLKIIATTSIQTQPVLEKIKKIKELGVDAVVQKPMSAGEWRTTFESVVTGVTLEGGV